MNKLRPSGHEYPACKRCNRGTSWNDQAVTAIAIGQAPKLLMDADPEYFRHFQKCIRGIGLGSIAHIFADASDTLLKRPSGILQNAVGIRVRAKAYREITLPWAVKFGLGIWYDVFKMPFRSEGLIGAETINVWNGNSEKFIAYLDCLRCHGHLAQGSWEEHEQFCYRYDFNPDGRFLGVYLKVHEYTRFFILLVENPELHPKTLDMSGFKYFRVSAENGIHSIQA